MSYACNSLGLGAVSLIIKTIVKGFLLQIRHIVIFSAVVGIFATLPSDIGQQKKICWLNFSLFSGTYAETYMPFLPVTGTYNKLIGYSEVLFCSLAYYMKTRTRSLFFCPMGYIWNPYSLKCPFVSSWDIYIKMRKNPLLQNIGILMQRRNNDL